MRKSMLILQKNSTWKEITDRKNKEQFAAIMKKKQAESDLSVFAETIKHVI